MTHLLDTASRFIWRVLGRQVDLAGAEAWLDAPINSGSYVGDSWVAAEAARRGGSVEPDSSDVGLMPSKHLLAGSEFDPERLDPVVRDFYEHTARWQMEVWSEWTPLFWPFGEAISRLWARRIEQLALPMRSLDVARGMESQITVIRDGGGRHVASAWTRRLRGTGRTVFSGAYATRTLPGGDQPSVHVTFPLESGNLQVFLRPRVTGKGDLVLESSSGAFGDDGAYVLVRGGRRTHACRVPMHEKFHVYVDEAGVLRTDHTLKVVGLTALRLHYKMEHRTMEPRR